MSAVKPSEAPVAAGPGSASPAAEEAERLDLCPEEEEPPDWSGEGELPTAFEVTREVADALAAELADHAPFFSERSAETVEVRQALSDLPAFLEVVRGEGLQENAALEEMQAMKARGVEHVRWRSVEVPDDIDSKAKILRMQGIAYERMRDTELFDTWCSKIGWRQALPAPSHLPHLRTSSSWKPNRGLSG